MTQPGQPFDSARPRPIVTSLDMVRPRLDSDGFDAAIFSLNAVAADLGYGDVRALPGSIAWIDRLRKAGKRIGVTADTEHAEAALEIARIADRIDVVVIASAPERRIARALEDLEVDPDRAVAVGVESHDVHAAHDAGIDTVISIARGAATPEQLRRAGATMIVADLQELLAAV